MKHYFKFTTLLLLCTLTLGFTSCKEDKPVAPVKIDFKKEGELTLFKGATDTIAKVFNIEVAKTDYEIQTGLMYRDSMKDNQGMLFVFPDVKQRSFYMKNTRIPLDLIFFDHNKRIVSFQENAKPMDESGLPSNTPAQFVLELNAGMAQKLLLDVGDKMDYFEYLLEK
ncbi:MULTISPECIES: DUF192 domain-containing protein [unclassified Olleya]|uniref:DUF192 domain-containing protein n=1 Tax=unclassified Olleya TaxID=2615019 RepID=UPI000C303DE3|nr:MULTISPECIES: DUF192 domain-containing protein [unclassified Olleya]AUC77413.1 hypothetical protein CW732_17715 [Olleya sp. Bg11-27]QXP59805.1 DUF192 domain-containing protein [Olleya sp. HaHaR_3_96]